MFWGSDTEPIQTFLRYTASQTDRWKTNFGYSSVAILIADKVCWKQNLFDFLEIFQMDTILNVRAPQLITIF